MMNSLIPVVESEDKQERWDIYSRLLKDRIIYLFEEVTDISASLIVAQLLYLESIGADKEINFYINSPGGSITAGMQIFDTMKTVSCPITTIGVGQCASMGSFLLAAGDKGHRFALPGCEIMIHQPLGGFRGQATDISIHAERILSMKKYLNKCYCVFTKKPLAEIERDTDRDNFMTAQEAKEYGLIDDVLVKNKMVDFLKELEKVS